MPKSIPRTPSKDHIYKPNPAPVKDPNFDKLGWDKGDFANNRDTKEPGEAKES